MATKIDATKDYNKALEAVRKLGAEEFTRRFILKYRTDGYKGVHSVYSGYNKEFRAIFDEDPVEFIKDSDFGSNPVRGGAIIYLPEDAQLQREKAAANKTAQTINLILAD